MDHHLVPQPGAGLRADTETNFREETGHATWKSRYESKTHGGIGPAWLQWSGKFLNAKLLVLTDYPDRF